MWTDLKEYVGSHTDSDDFVARCWEEASMLVTNFIGQSAVPETIKDRAILEVGSELYHRRNAPSGVAQFSSFDGQPVRVARDPMVAAYPLLSPYVPVGF